MKIKPGDLVKLKTMGTPYERLERLSQAVAVGQVSLDMAMSVAFPTPSNRPDIVVFSDGKMLTLLRSPNKLLPADLFERVIVGAA